jgi:hypothetical protein
VKYFVVACLILLLGCCAGRVVTQVISPDAYRNSSYAILNMFDTVISSTVDAVLEECRGVRGNLKALGMTGPGVQEVENKCSNVTTAFKGTHKARVDLQAALQGEDEAKIKLRTSQYKRSITILDAMVISAEETLRGAIAAITFASQPFEEETDSSTETQGE